jgi:uncharacterized membrane protein
MTSFKAVVEAVGLVIDAAGVAAIVLGLLIAVARFAAAKRWRTGGTGGTAGTAGAGGSYRAFRQDVGRGILLGLEFLVAADIIRTVAVSPTVENVLVLALIVLIRTFLSMALQVELEGRWPWQQHRRDDERPGAPGASGGGLPEA